MLKKKQRKIHNTYMSFYIYFLDKVPTCGVEEALVSGNNPIPDAHITASSEYDVHRVARNARINNTAGAGAWMCSVAERDAPERRMFLQVCPLVTILVIQSSHYQYVLSMMIIS